jgi:hypothetical protein
VLALSLQPEVKPVHGADVTAELEAFALFIVSFSQAPRSGR